MNPGVLPPVEHTTPGRSPPYPIVAIGASAGGIEAMGTLLKALPADTGMAFVVIQHLSPAHESLLAEILGRAAPIPVAEVKDQTPVKPNHVYVIPPNKHLVLGEGLLQLSPRTEMRGQPRPIDHFMRSLAEEHGHKAIGVVLSGSGTDGTLGLEEIKAGGGITFAQDASAEQPSMPSSAIASGTVDFVLPPAEIARELARIASHPYVKPPAADDPGSPPEPAFGRVLDLVRSSTGVDFANYKRNTLHRRITRRMVLHHLENLREYLRLLQAKPDEVDALYRDVLINVTSFFRNPDAYEALKTSVFPKLSGDRNRHEPVRVWALGCSTGEEAYSLAMTYTEYIEETGRRVPMQVFATDLNGMGIDRARAGVYSRNIAQDVSPERLRRFFVDMDGSYLISKPIRDMCVFARQNALTDPPFSRIDLVACRNLLIYLEPVLQQRLIPLLHYALRPNGFLWLGGSETIGTFRDLFEPIDNKHRIYLRKAATRVGGVHVPGTGRRWVPAEDTPQERAAPAREPGPDPQKEADRLLLSRYVPPCVLLNENLEILQFRGDTGPYLAPAPGRATHSLVKMLREGLLVPLRQALARARRDRATVREEGLRVRSESGWRDVDVTILPVRPGASDSAYLVLFEEPAERAIARAREIAANARRAAERMVPGDAKGREQELVQLRQELAATREYLQSVIEQQEAANEDLQSANEEVQSANEELQSINEELETSKEEIQSANEELATVNDELQNRNIELSRTNNDLTNLLSSVSMAIVMLGPDLRIRRFTQTAEKALNLIHADVGRPFSDIQLSVPVPNLEEAIAEVIASVTTYEREVKGRDGRWYSLRIRPYRTLENKIDGAVLMLIDVENLKRAEHAIRESEKRFEVLADSAPVLIWVNDLDGCRFVNRAFEEFVGEPENAIRAVGVEAFVHAEDRPAYVEAYSDAARDRRRFETRARMRRADGGHRWMKVVGIPRIVGDRLEGFVGSSFDITDMADAESALLELDRGKNEFLAMLAHELRNPLAGVRNATHLIGQARDGAVFDHAREIIERQTAQMVRLVDDLLDVSRITYGKIVLRTQCVDLVESLKRAVEATDAERAELQQEAVTTYPETPLSVRGDAARLEQVFVNLLANASKFTGNGGKVWVSLKEDRGADSGPGWAVVKIRDNGVGVDTALLPRLFELFAQADRPVGARGGMGLGLALAKRLVDLHGGIITAHSAGLGLGSEFAVRLPLIAAEAPAKATPKAAPKSIPAAAGSPRRVLIVDDDTDAGDTLRLILALSGHEVAVVRSGEEAPARAAQLEAQVVLVDIGLPDRDGLSVAREIRAHPRTRDALIVAITGFGREADRARSMQAGIDLHLTKPVDIDRLLEHIANGAAERRRPDRPAPDLS